MYSKAGNYNSQKHLAYHDQSTIVALSPREGERVLEAGCRSGEKLLVFGHLGCISIGIDPSLAALHLAKRRFPSISVLQCDLVKTLPFSNRCFDAVVFDISDEHVDAARFIFREFYRVLRPQGRIVLSLKYPAIASKQRRIANDFNEIDFALGYGPYRLSVNDYVASLRQSGFYEIRQHEHRHASSKRLQVMNEEIESGSTEYPTHVVLQAIRD